MNRRLSVASILMILAAPIQAAADDSALPAGATILHLTERADRMLPRDEIVAVLRVETTGKAPREVQGEVNRRMAAALAEAKKAAAVKIETPSMNAYETRDPKKGTVWTASQSLRLQSKDFGATLSLVGTLEDQGLAVASLTFEVSPEALAGVQDGLTAEALKQVRARAEAIATDLGLAVDHVKTVIVGNAAAPGPQPRAMMAGAPAAMPPPAAEPGEAPASIVVDAEIVLVPKH